MPHIEIHLEGIAHQRKPFSAHISSKAAVLLLLLACSWSFVAHLQKRKKMSLLYHTLALHLARLGCCWSCKTCPLARPTLSASSSNGEGGRTFSCRLQLVGKESDRSANCTHSVGRRRTNNLLPIPIHRSNWVWCNNVTINPAAGQGRYTHIASGTFEFLKKLMMKYKKPPGPGH